MKLLKSFTITFVFCGFFLFLTEADAFLGKDGLTFNPWPPEVGKAYPDLELIDQEGHTFRLSALRGKVVIIEPIGMNCPACQAFSGAHKVGSFGGIKAQPGLKSIHQILPYYGDGVRLPNKDVVLVQLLLYDMDMQHPTPEDAAAWAKHFDMRMGHNEIVAVSTSDMRGKVAYNMIPGFQLISRSFVLKADSTGHKPKDSLYKDLLPMVKDLL